MDPDTWNALTPAQQNAVLQGPALAPPTGVQSQFANPPNHNAMVIAVTSICLILATTFVLLRVYSKAFIDRRVNIEDGFVLIAFGTYVGCVWAVLESVHLNGFFVHQWDMTLQTLLEVLYPFFFISFFYAFTMLFAKTAIVIEWIRIFVPHRTRSPFFWMCALILCCNVIFYVAAIFVLALTCRPIQKTWNPMEYGTCFTKHQQRVFDYSSACINFVLDILLLITPQATIWKLNLATKQKIGVSIIFSLGVLACGAALGRVISGRTWIYGGDSTWAAGAPTMCVIAEMTCAFIVFCAPIVPKVFRSQKTGVITKVAQTLRSWSKIRSRNRSAASDLPLEEESGAAGVYQKVPVQAEFPLARLSHTARES